MINGDDLVPLLGLHVESPAVERLRQELDPLAEISESDGDFFLSFPEKGIELLFDGERELEAAEMEKFFSGEKSFPGTSTSGMGGAFTSVTSAHWRRFGESPCPRRRLTSS